MRPIIALSPILKLLESRFRDKIENYMLNQMMQSQVEFVRNCVTHVNIVRLIKRCLTRNNGIGKLKSLNLSQKHYYLLILNQHNSKIMLI